MQSFEKKRKNPFISHTPGAYIDPRKGGVSLTDTNAFRTTLMSQTVTRAGSSQRPGFGGRHSMNYNLPDTQLANIQHKLSKYSPLKEGGDGIGKNLKRPREFLHK